MEDLQTYRARIGLYRHRLASKRNVPPHKRASCRQREQKRRQDRTKLKTSRRGSATKLNPVASSVKMVFGITRGFAIIVIAILLMAGLTSGHMETVQFFAEKELQTNFPESHVDGLFFTPALQQNYVIPSSTCDCLLGNAGVHAYNGNPRTPGSDDDTDMDWKANVDTPSDTNSYAGEPVSRHLSREAASSYDVHYNVESSHMRSELHFGNPHMRSEVHSGNLHMRSEVHSGNPHMSTVTHSSDSIVQVQSSIPSQEQINLERGQLEAMEYGENTASPKIALPEENTDSRGCQTGDRIPHIQTITAGASGPEIKHFSEEAVGEMVSAYLQGKNTEVPAYPQGGPTMLQVKKQKVNFSISGGEATVFGNNANVTINRTDDEAKALMTGLMSELKQIRDQRMPQKKSQKTSGTQTSDGQLEVGGDERSTIYRSQLAEQIQRLEIDIRKKHADMIRELKGYISPELRNEWNLFQNGLTPYLTMYEIYGSCVTFVGDHCEILLSKNIIKLGDYSVLFEVVNSIDERAGDIVKRATTAIKDIKTRISDLKPKARSDHITSLAYKEEDLSFENTEESSTFLKASTSPRERTIYVGKRENMINQTEKLDKVETG